MKNANKMFSVNEIFESIEGEGVRTGYLTVFIRLNGCNLNCGYCDTKYAQKPQKPNMSLAEIVEKVKSYNIPRVTITGGEPLLHENIKYLVENLAFGGYQVNIETNGSVLLEDFTKLPNVFVTMDWKCPSSGMNSEMLACNLRSLGVEDVLKFVVGTQKDLEEFLKIYNETFECGCSYYISPVFEVMEPKTIVEFMKENTIAFAAVQVQLHKIIWDPNERGV